MAAALAAAMQPMVPMHAGPPAGPPGVYHPTMAAQAVAAAQFAAGGPAFAAAAAAAVAGGNGHAGLTDGVPLYRVNMGRAPTNQTASASGRAKTAARQETTAGEGCGGGEGATDATSLSEDTEEA